MLDRDDFRVRVQLAQPQRLLKALREAQVRQREREALGRRVAATHEEDHVFLYADTRARASALCEIVRGVMDEHGIEGTVTVWRWHPIEERWEDASKPLPATEAQREAEHERRIADEDRESRESPYQEWEVRVSLPTHHDADALAQRLQREGIPCKRFWRHLLLGALDEDAASALASKLRREAASGSEVVVEAVGEPIWEAMHPFAVFGGIAY